MAVRRLKVRWSTWYLVISGSFVVCLQVAAALAEQPLMPLTRAKLAIPFVGWMVVAYGQGLAEIRSNIGRIHVLVGFFFGFQRFPCFRVGENSTDNTCEMGWSESVMHQPDRLDLGGPKFWWKVSWQLIVYYMDLPKQTFTTKGTVE